MKLYYSPGACSLSPHIVLHEAGIDFEAVLASTKTHKLEDGTDYYRINPKGYVPLLELDDGRRLAEGPAIVQYIADQAPRKKLAPANGSFERYQLQAWLTFVSSELHKAFGVLFTPGMPDDAKALTKKKIVDRLQWVDGELAGRDYLLGDFSVADTYLFTVTRWTVPMGIDTSALKNVTAFMARMSERPAVKAALQHEGLLKKA